VASGLKELAALCQQHFGAAMDASGLPTNFASTAPAYSGCLVGFGERIVPLEKWVGYW
jgi:hypothetical protein